MRSIIIILVVVICGCKEPSNEKETALSKEKKTIVQPRLTELNDHPINLGQFKGRTIFINFWATWCKPCIREMPSIKNAQELLNKTGVVFLFASSESSDQINEFKKDHNYDFKYVRLVNMEELNVEALPTTYIFNPKGELVFSEMGSRKWDDTTNIKMILKINDQK